tara:strand:+ start:1544 stop:1756 length:213 start_codon:yes stop_codon:yes gene_type:complete
MVTALPVLVGATGIQNLTVNTVLVVMIVGIKSCLSRKGRLSRNGRLPENIQIGWVLAHLLRPPMAANMPV